MIKYKAGDHGHCVSCGEPAGYDHKCDPDLERRIEAGRKSHENIIEYPRSYHRRLSDGFNLMRDDDE